jgi:hypothetical protein
MDELRELVAGDDRRYFHDTYTRTTRAIADAAGAGRFDDRSWVERVMLHRREHDHRRIDEVLAARVADEGDELAAVSHRTLLDRLLTPLNRVASRRFIAEARRKVWRNAAVLDRARRIGLPAYERAVRELERCSAARVADLCRPGQVIVRGGGRGKPSAIRSHLVAIVACRENHAPPR